MSETRESESAACLLGSLLVTMPPQERIDAVMCALDLRPSETIQESFIVGPLRALIADCWEEEFREAIPIRGLREIVSRIPRTAMKEHSVDLGEAEHAFGVQDAVLRLFRGLHRCLLASAHKQLTLFDAQPASSPPTNVSEGSGQVVTDLRILIEQRKKFRTIYADPPWRYDNEASRGAAADHYPTMSVDEICAEPVRELAANNSHLHLWTTNAFLPSAFRVLKEWGFEYWSCFVWVKSELGMGNYWRVSHEYLLLGVRGRQRFRDRCQSSWICLPRTVHSRKPGRIRLLVERVSPGPYLELYGRAEIRDSDWTVYGNQVGRCLY